MNSNNQGGSRGRSKSKDLFTGWFSKKNNNSDGAIVSPLLDQDGQQNEVYEAEMVQPGQGKTSKPTFSLGVIGSSMSPVRTLNSPKEAHDMYSRLPSGEFGDEDDEDESQNFLRNSNNVNNGGSNYMPSMNSVEMTSTRSVAEKRAINNDALERQRRNNEQFMQQMKAEEDQAIASYARRKSQEEESLRLAMQLQAQEEQLAMQQQQQYAQRGPPARGRQQQQQQQQQNNVHRKRVVVPLPPNVRPGQILRVQVPGHGLLSVQVPHGATPGQALEFYVAPPQNLETKKVRVVLPPNAVPGQNITVKVPGVGTHVTVQVPLGAMPGNTVEFMVQVPANSVAENVAPQMDQKERQQFLESLPEDIRNEILAQERAERQRLTGVPPPREEEHVEDKMSAQEKQAFYDSLPPEIRQEVMAQEHMQQKAMTKKKPKNESNAVTKVVESSPIVVVNDAPNDKNTAEMAELALTEEQPNMKKPPAQETNEDDLSLGFNNDEEKDTEKPAATVHDDGPLLDFDDVTNTNSANNKNMNNSNQTGFSFMNNTNNSNTGNGKETANPPAPQLTLPPNLPPQQPFQQNPIQNIVGNNSTLGDENPFKTMQQQQQQQQQKAQQQQPSVAAEKPLDRLRKAKGLLNEGLIEQAEYDEIKKVVMAQLKGQR